MLPSFSPLQRTKGQRYRFSLLVQEMKGAETEEYVACILAFINCIIAGAPDVTSRVTLRNEVIGEHSLILIVATSNMVSSACSTSAHLS